MPSSCCQVTSVVSDSVQPHRWQPTRLPRPWDSPGKNTGVGRHFLLQHMKVKSESEVAQSCPTPSDPMDCLPGSSVHGIFQSTGVGCHCLLKQPRKKAEPPWPPVPGSPNISIKNTLSVRGPWSRAKAGSPEVDPTFYPQKPASGLGSKLRG